MAKKKNLNWILKQQRDVTKIFKPKVHYDEECDFLYITWLPFEKRDFSLETDNGIVFDISKDEEIVGVEIQDFKKKIKEKRRKKQ